jgi:signal transduction histidine kinase
MKSGMAMLNNDLTVAQEGCYWDKAAVSMGYNCMLALPLKAAQSDCFGVLLCYAERANFIDELQIQLLSEVVADLSFTIDKLTTAKKNILREHNVDQSLKMEVVGHLAAQMAHDFNNVLTGVLGYTELAINELPSNQQRLEEFLHHIRRSGERAMDLMAQLSFFNHGSKNQEHLASVVDVTSVIRSLVDSLRNATSSRSLPQSLAVEVKTSTTRKPLFSKISLLALQQIVSNLLLNARDATAGKGKVGISLSRCSAQWVQCQSCGADVDGQYVLIEVNDSGIGIEEHLLGGLFDPFYTTKNDGSNVGMGLALVHSLVHKAHGHIKVSSNQTDGSQFAIYLPAAQQ